jgi:ABC-type sulfate/molybdate transport systems ATPase subunit
MLELKTVSRTAGGLSLNGFSLAIVSGRPTAIVGLSPAAREAFARLVSGADRPQSGEVRLGGELLGKARRRKGVLVRVGSAGIAPTAQAVGRVVGREAAALAGLSRELESRLASLSAGQRMKLALAQAALAGAKLVILEAPTAQLSHEEADDIFGVLPGLLAPAQGVVVMLAATAGEALALNGDIVVLESGAIIQSGGAGEVSAFPVSLASAVATSWPQLNRLGMTAKDGRWLLSDGSRLQLPEDAPTNLSGVCTLAFHPEDMALERASEGCIRFVVRAGEPAWGGYLKVFFAGAEWVCPLAGTPPHAGALLNVFVDRARLILFDAEGRPVT